MASENMQHLKAREQFTYPLLLEAVLTLKQSRYLIDIVPSF